MKIVRLPSILASVSVASFLSLALISVTAGIAAAKPALQVPVSIVDVLKYVFDGVFLAQVLSMAGLILLDWALGVSLAVRDSKFDFKALANFYRSAIMPKLIGWVAFTVVLKVAAFFAVGELINAIPLSVAGLCFAILMVSLVADVASKAKDLLGSDVIPPYAPPAAK